MLKATIVAFFVLSTITCTTYGAPANAKDDDAIANAIERSGLVSSRNRRDLSAGQCINYLYVMAYTSGLMHAETDNPHRISLQVKGSASTRSLPAPPGDDYSPNKGDLWKLNLRGFFGLTGCTTINDIDRISIVHGNDNGWNIDSIVTFAVVDQNDWELTSADFDVFQWIDEDSEAEKLNFTLSLHTSEGQCINYLYVMAYTSDLQDAGSDDSHRISLQVKGSARTKSLPVLPGDDYSPNKGDLWKLNLEDFFGFTGCIRINDIDRISILEGNNNGWNIDSIVTFAVADQNNWELTSADFDVFQWIDGDSEAEKFEFTLSLHTSEDSGGASSATPMIGILIGATVLATGIFM